MRSATVLFLFASGLVFALTGCQPASEPAADGATVEIFVPGSVIQAIEGIDIGPDGMIYGTSIHAQAVYRIDPESGAVTVAVPPPYGESDDVAVGPAGSPVEGVLAWVDSLSVLSLVFSSLAVSVSSARTTVGSPARRRSKHAQITMSFVFGE